MEDKIVLDVVAGDEVKKIIIEVRKQWVFMISLNIIFNMFTIAIAVHRYVLFSGKAYRLWQNILIAKVFPITGVVNAFVSTAAGIIYYKAIKIQKQSVFSGDQQLFNDSFKLTKKANYFAMTSIVLNFFILLFYFLYEVIFDMPK